MPAMKLIRSTSGTFLPHTWHKPLGMPSHIQQGNVLVVAANKRGAADILTGCTSRFEAERLAGGMRISRAPYDLTVGMLIDTGVVDLNVPSAYAWWHAVGNSVVVRLEGDGTLTPVAYFRSDRTISGSGLYLEVCATTAPKVDRV